VNPDKALSIFEAHMASWWLENRSFDETRHDNRPETLSEIAKKLASRKAYPE